MGHWLGYPLTISSILQTGYQMKPFQFCAFGRVFRMSYIFDPFKACLPSLLIPRLDSSGGPGQLRVGMALLWAWCWLLARIVSHNKFSKSVSEHELEGNSEEMMKQFEQMFGAFENLVCLCSWNWEGWFLVANGEHSSCHLLPRWFFRAGADDSLLLEVVMNAYVICTYLSSFKTFGEAARNDMPWELLHLCYPNEGQIWMFQFCIDWIQGGYPTYT